MVVMVASSMVRVHVPLGRCLDPDLQNLVLEHRVVSLTFLILDWSIVPYRSDRYAACSQHSNALSESVTMLSFCLILPLIGLPRDGSKFRFFVSVRRRATQTQTLPE